MIITTNYKNKRKKYALTTGMSSMRLISASQKKLSGNTNGKCKNTLVGPDETTGNGRVLKLSDNRYMQHLKLENWNLITTITLSSMILFQGLKPHYQRKEKRNILFLLTGELTYSCKYQKCSPFKRWCFISVMLSWQKHGWAWVLALPFLVMWPWQILDISNPLFSSEM